MWHDFLLCPVLRFILSDDRVCLSYKKINYCKIRNSIIKTAMLFDRKHFLVYICVSKVLFLAYI